MVLNVFEKTTSKVGILNVTNKTYSVEFHRLKNWFCSSFDIEIASEPRVSEFHSLERPQSIAYGASRYSMLHFDIDDNDSIFSSFLFVIQRWFRVFVLSKKFIKTLKWKSVWITEYFLYTGSILYKTVKLTTL